MREDGERKKGRKGNEAKDRPCPLPVGRVEKDPEKLRLAYEMGREAATGVLSQIKEFLR